VTFKLAVRMSLPPVPYGANLFLSSTTGRCKCGDVSEVVQGRDVVSTDHRQEVIYCLSYMAASPMV